MARDCRQDSPSFETEEQSERLQAKVAAIDKISHEDEVLIARETRIALFEVGGRVSDIARAAAFSFVIVFVVPYVLAAQGTAPSTSAAIGANGFAKLFLQFGVGDLCGRLNVLGRDVLQSFCGGIAMIFAGHTSGNFEKLEQVIELTVNVTANGYWRGYRLSV